MCVSNLNLTEAEGVSALLQDRVLLEQKVCTKKRTLEELYHKKLQLMKELKIIESNILSEFSDIADFNELIDANQSVVNKLLGPGISISVKC